MENQNPRIPPPPALDIAVRTMESDIKSLETSGGTITAPEFFSFARDEEDVQNEGIAITGYAGPEKPVFASAARQISSGAPGMSPIATVGIAIGIAVFFGVLGYFVIFPALFGK